jgi:hypothetical protein
MQGLSARTDNHPPDLPATLVATVAGLQPGPRG